MKKWLLAGMLFTYALFGGDKERWHPDVLEEVQEIVQEVSEERDFLRSLAKNIGNDGYTLEFSAKGYNGGFDIDIANALMALNLLGEFKYMHYPGEESFLMEVAGKRLYYEFNMSSNTLKEDSFGDKFTYTWPSKRSVMIVDSAYKDDKWYKQPQPFFSQRLTDFGHNILTNGDSLFADGSYNFRILHNRSQPLLESTIKEYVVDDSLGYKILLAEADVKKLANGSPRLEYAAGLFFQDSDSEVLVPLAAILQLEDVKYNFGIGIVSIPREYEELWVMAKLDGL